MYSTDSCTCTAPPLFWVNLSAILIFRIKQRDPPRQTSSPAFQLGQSGRVDGGCPAGSSVLQSAVVQPSMTTVTALAVVSSPSIVVPWNRNHKNSPELAAVTAVRNAVELESALQLVCHVANEAR